ncbi:hypothetical protein PybrP1_001974 [[Pythium] brassicae (nom. inval.)]|nr:hypothetical protein PybrP1_001974 [[Pythium] brassicae (nom. inval.)]
MPLVTRSLVLLLLLCAASRSLGHGNLRDVRVGSPTAPAPEGANLPVFFFHGLGSNAHSGDNFRSNLTADGRVFVPLTFCQDACSGRALSLQIGAAITAIKAIVSSDAVAFKDGYIFVGLSQGAMVARGVVEYWDDHNVKMLVSLSGPQNGLFYGPQLSDFLALGVLSVYGPKAVDPRLFDFSKFTPADYGGRIQRAIAGAVLNPLMTNQLALVDMLHPPVTKQWVALNPYGLQTLDKRGGLFLHAVPNVGHSCWVRDYITADGGLDCKFQPVYDAHIYPVLRDPLRTKHGQSDDVNTLAL